MAARGGEPALDAYTAKLQGAKSLKVTFTLSAGAPPAEATLSYSSPNRLRLETPTKLAVSDGTTLWVLNKTDNTYTQAAAGTGPALEDSVYAWRGFFVKTPFAEATDITSTGKRTIKGVELSGYKLTLPGGKTATVYLNADGLATVGQVMSGGNTVTSIASKIELGEAALPDSTFSFTPPEGAKKIEAPVPTVASFASAEAVFRQYCTGCHGAQSKRAGLGLATYEDVMAGSRSGAVVVPGDPGSSKVVQVLNGGNPKMPPGPDAVPADSIKAISDWIQAGAKAP